MHRLMKRYVKWPSSGMAVYAASTQFCRSISLFGFYPFTSGPDNRAVLHHYFEKTFFYSTGPHDVLTEYDALLDLNKQGAIRLINDCRLQ